MKVGLISDTHGYLDTRVYEYFSKVDEIWHAGDIGNIEVLDQLHSFRPTIAVYGNVDDQKVRLSCPEYQAKSINGLRVLMIHIGGTPLKYNLKANQLIKKHQPKLLICGHSHILNVVSDKQNNLLYMNPGAAGLVGFHKVRTLLRFEIVDGNIGNVQAIELGIRSKKKQD